MSQSTSNSSHPICPHNIPQISDFFGILHIDIQARNLTIILNYFRSAFIYNESLLTINSTFKISLNQLIPPTTILIFFLLDYCHSFLMHLPISKVTTFHSTHWTAARVCFPNNKSDLVTHTIKILQWIAATYSMKIQTPEHSLQRLVLI